MTAPVDVLAWIDAATRAVEWSNNADIPVRRDAPAARAAVAELIEADKEYDEAKAAFYARRPGDYDVAKALLTRAEKRRSAALARISGGE